MKLHQRKIAQFMFVLLAAGLIILVVGGPARIRTFFATRLANQKTTQPQPNEGALALPIPLNHPSVGSVLIHYFLSGVVKEVRNVQGGSILVLRDVATEGGFPDLLIAPDTRIAKISPPYSAQTSVPVKIGELKPGRAVDISIEYDLRSKTWLLRDVFLPTDKNPSH